MSSRTIHSSHWGSYYVITDDDGDVERVEPTDFDRMPTALFGNISDSVHHRTRVRRPAIRRGWLEAGPGADSRRGYDSYVEVDWPTLERILADELTRVYGRYGTAGVFGGSYGWSSAGRFHHAQSQVHRFLNTLGGYVRSVNDYSTGASTVAMRHVVGAPADAVHAGPMWSEIRAHTELLVSFGGLPMKNLFIAPGGNSSHAGAEALTTLAGAGVEVVVFSPLQDDLPAELNGQWHATRPGTDCAVMLALAYEILSRGMQSQAFLSRYTVGSAQFIDYVLGKTDGVPKTAAWAEQFSGVPEDVIRSLAPELVRRRSLVNVMWSLQRGEFGEQPSWMALALASLVGQVGQPGCGFAHGLGSMGDIGKNRLAIRDLPTLPQGVNGCDLFIPVSRVTDMLLCPGDRFNYNGGSYVYPDVKLVYWGGGNPFHHQQNLARLQAAVQSIDTLVVHESYWTSTAKHADIVVPSTISLERNDLGASRSDSRIIAMKKAVEPYEEARNDFDTFARLSNRITGTDDFDLGLAADDWVRNMYEDWALAVASVFDPPSFSEFWNVGWVELPVAHAPKSFLEEFLADPVTNRLETPSGKIEIFSETVAGFNYCGARGHPSWMPPAEVRDPGLRVRYPLVLLANQPRTRLHSQLDVGATSQASKIADREPARVNAADAAERGVSTGDLIEIESPFGRCLAGAQVSEAVPRGIMQLSTGAWFDPVRCADGVLCGNGNPNILTSDRGTSELAQSSAGAYVNVDFRKYTDPAFAIHAYSPPAFSSVTLRQSG